MLDTTLLNSIRTILGVDAETLPDTTLTDPLLGGVVEREVLALVGDPPYDDRPVDEQERIRRAIAYRTAAMALGSGAMREARAITQERYGQQYSVSRNGGAVDPDGWAAQLRASALAELEPLIPRRAVTIPHFRLAHGRRGA